MKAEAVPEATRAGRRPYSAPTSRTAWSTSPSAMPSAPVSRDASQFRGGDALQRMPPAESGVIVLNPPYGERIEVGGVARGREQAQTEDGGEFFIAARQPLEEELRRLDRLGADARPASCPSACG